MITFSLSDKGAARFAQVFDQITIETGHLQACRINITNQMYNMLILRT